MIQIGPKDKILVAKTAIDFRCGIDSLVGSCKNNFKEDPFNGTYYVFSNKSKCGIKILYYDGQGFWLFQKRFSKGKLVWWPEGKSDLLTIDAKNFLLLIFNGDPGTAKFQKNWKEFN
jgi:transposase